MRHIFLTYGVLLFTYLLGFGQSTDTQLVERSGQKFSQVEHEKVSEYLKLLKKSEDGNATAMYQLSFYHATDKQKIKWLQKSADLGYSPAWHKLGVMYKYGDGVTLDYAKAFNCFQSAADTNFPPGIYSKGYMLYKGLGCEQDYYKAFQEFEKGANLKDPSSMYMLGLCYRNGYGVSVDTDKAYYWLYKSAELGYEHALHELETSTPENNPKAIELIEKFQRVEKLAEKVDYPVNQITQIVNTTDFTKLDGKFHGYLIRYDWSGKKILEIKELELDIDYEDNSLSGFWVEEGLDEPIAIHATLIDDKLIFNNVNAKRSGHYFQNRSFEYDFEEMNAAFYVYDNEAYLQANLIQFSKEKMEPERPYSLIVTNKVLSDKFVQNHEQNIIKNVNAFPNPFQDIVQVKFSLSKSAEAQIRVTSLEGKLLFNTPTSILEKGDYIMPLNIQLPSGMYLMSIGVADEITSFPIIKSQ